MTVKVVCGWCRRSKAPDGFPTGPIVPFDKSESTGICKQCRAQYFPETVTTRVVLRHSYER